MNEDNYNGRYYTKTEPKSVQMAETVSRNQYVYSEERRGVVKCVKFN